MTIRRLLGRSRLLLTWLALAGAGQAHASGQVSESSSAAENTGISTTEIGIAQHSASTFSKIWRARGLVDFKMSTTSVNVGEAIRISIWESAPAREEFEKKVKQGTIKVRILSGGRESIRYLLAAVQPSDPRVVDGCYLYESSLHQATPLGAVVRLVEPTIDWLGVSDGGLVTDEHYVVWLEEVAPGAVGPGLELLRIPIKEPQMTSFLEAGIEVIVRKPTGQWIEPNAVLKKRRERESDWRKRINEARSVHIGCPTWTDLAGGSVMTVANSDCQVEPDFGGRQVGVPTDRSFPVADWPAGDLPAGVGHEDSAAPNDRFRPD